MSEPSKAGFGAIFAFFLGIALGGVGFWYYATYIEDPGAANPPPARQTPPVQVVKSDAGAESVTEAGDAATAPDADRIAALVAANEALKTDLAKAQAEAPADLTELPKKNEELQASVAALEAKVTELEAKLAAADPSQGRDADIYRFGMKEKTPFFDQADWPTLSRQFTDLKGGIRAVLEEFRDTGEVSMETRLEVGKKNQPLAIFAVGASNDLEGTGPNGAFTHPAVMANFVRAVLAERGNPLTKAQDAAIRGHGDDWVKREDARAKTYDQETPALQKTVEEIDSKMVFMDAMRGELTPAQQEILYDPQVDHRLQLDLFSPVLVYVTRVPIHAPDRDTLEARLVKTFFSTSKVDRDPQQYAWLGGEWLQMLPSALRPIDEKTDRVDLAFPRLEVLQNAARAQVAITRKLLDTENLSPEAQQALRESTSVLTPQLVAPTDKGE